MIPISGLKQRDITGRHNFGWNYAPVDVHTTWWRLTHWGRVTHICVGKLTIIGSDNGLSPERRQAIIWTNAGILLIGPLGTNFSDILIEIQTFSLKKTRLKMSSAKCCSFRLGLNVLSRSGCLLVFFHLMMMWTLPQIVKIQNGTECKAIRKSPSGSIVISSSWGRQRRKTNAHSAHYYDEIIKWKHFPRYWPFVQEIDRSPVNSPYKGQRRGALMFSLICTWTNGVNNGEAGDLRRHRAHYEVRVMFSHIKTIPFDTRL